MRLFFGRIVETCGDWWIYIGWILFFCAFLVPFYARTDPSAVYAAVVLGVLFLVWWLVDVVDQCVPGWQIAAGIALLALGFLPRGSFLIVACWVIYCMKVRE